MRKLFTFLFIVTITANVFAQAPQKMSYQAVVRNSSNALVVNQNVGLKISILDINLPVYVETQTPTTNANGLITTEIGGGMVVSGSFSSLNWSTKTYTLKTEIDPTGGTNYTITSTSKFLSVPYSLNAKSADSLTGAQAVKLNGIAAGAEVNVQADWNQTNTSADDYIKNKPVIPTATVINAGTNVTVTGTGTTASPYVINTTSSTPLVLTIGQSYQGGQIFYLDSTKQHGLIVSTVDINTVLVSWWHQATTVYTFAERNGIGAGMYNTERIITKMSSLNYVTTAAGLCSNYQGGGYGDWYLPSKAEFQEIWSNRILLNMQSNNKTYWTSNETAGTTSIAVAFYFPNNVFQDKDKYADKYNVRAVRKF